MARIRTIKPEFWLNEGLSCVSAESALLAIGLLNYADDYGYFLANPKLIKAAIFPLRECSLSTQCMLDELLSINYVSIIKSADGKQYGLINTFRDHQVISRKTPSKIKDLFDVICSNESINLKVNYLLSEDSVSAPCILSEDSHQERKGKERNREQGTGNREQGKARDGALSHPRKSGLPILPSGVHPQTWDGFLALRKAKKAPVTAAAIAGIEREAKIAGWTLEQALQECCARGWTGFKSDWVLKDQPKKTQYQLNQEGIARSLGLIPRDDMQERIINGEFYDTENDTKSLD